LVTISVPTYPSQEWLEAWATIANSSTEFRSSGAGWSGGVGLVIEADPGLGVPETLYLRLDGDDGRWTEVGFGRHPGLVEGTVFTIRAPYLRWKQVIRQELDPVKGVLQGKLVLRGHLPVVLRWIRAIRILAKLAGRVETSFVDERGGVKRGRAGDGT
jgi:putative sterol carrier protein